MYCMRSPKKEILQRKIHEVTKPRSNFKAAPTSTMVINASLESFSTSRVFSQDLLNTPSIANTPMPSTTSRVKRNGMVSGVGSNFPCSNATPWKQ